jgi:hypothetical protein
MNCNALFKVSLYRDIDKSNACRTDWSAPYSRSVRVEFQSGLSRRSLFSCICCHCSKTAHAAPFVDGSPVSDLTGNVVLEILFLGPMTELVLLMTLLTLQRLYSVEWLDGRKWIEKEMVVLILRCNFIFYLIFPEKSQKTSATIVHVRITDFRNTSEESWSFDRDIQFVHQTISASAL